MSGYYGPGQPPPGLPTGPPAGRPRPNGNGPRVFALAATTVLLIATAVSFAVTRSGGAQASGGTNGTLQSTFVGLSVVPNPSFPTGVGAAGGTTTHRSAGATVTAVPPRATKTVRPAPTTHPPVTTVPPPVVTMSEYGVRNVLYKFFDGFLYHRLSDIRAAVCPKYRYLYNGTYVLHPSGYEFQKWRSSSYTLLPGQNYVDIYVAVTLRNPRTGVVGGTWNHTWVITKDHSSYYVCGYI